MVTGNFARDGPDWLNVNNFVLHEMKLQLHWWTSPKQMLWGNTSTRELWLSLCSPAAFCWLAGWFVKCSFDARLEMLSGSGKSAVSQLCSAQKTAGIIKECLWAQYRVECGTVSVTVSVGPHSHPETQPPTHTVFFWVEVCRPSVNCGLIRSDGKI